MQIPSGTVRHARNPISSPLYTSNVLLLCSGSIQAQFWVNDKSSPSTIHAAEATVGYLYFWYNPPLTTLSCPSLISLEIPLLI